MSETNRFGQTFYPVEADAEHPEGCRCTGMDSGGECDWCNVYYGRAVSYDRSQPTQEDLEASDTQFEHDAAAEGRGGR